MQTKNRLFGLTAAGVLAAGLLFAQAPVNPGARQKPRSQEKIQDRVERRNRFIANYLDLTEAQQTQLTAIREQARAQSQVLQQERQQLRDQIREALQSGASDATLEQLAMQDGELFGQLQAIQLKTQAHIRALLSPEQLEKMKDVNRGLGNMRNQRGRMGMGPNLP